MQMKTRLPNITLQSAALIILMVLGIDQALQNSTLNSIILYLFMGKELLSIGDSLSYYLLKIKAWLGEQN